MHVKDILQPFGVHLYLEIATDFVVLLTDETHYNSNR